MKIIQIVTNLNIGDAIGNDILSIDDELKNAGYPCEIQALTIHDSLSDRAHSLDFKSMDPSDLILFHKATGDDLTDLLARVFCKKVVIYHNITPAKFFLPYDPIMAWNLRRGRHQLKKLARIADYGWADSEYNCRELAENGFPKNKLSVLPIFYDSSKAEEKTDPTLDAKLKKVKGTKFLFIGRIVPNKKQEEIIKVFYRYLQTEDANAKLYLIGSWQGLEKYYAKLKGFIWDLGLTDQQVIFPGHVTEAEKESYLKNADVFVCMSEHEGFCVPLLEAMSRSIPIAAYSSSAVTETLGDNGLLFQNKDYDAIASKIGTLCHDSNLRESVIVSQRNNFSRFDIDRTRQRLLELIKTALEGG